MAMPAMSQPAVNTQRLGATAMTSTAATASSEPAVITARGPRRSRMRPTGIPAMAEVSSAAENAAVAALVDQPVSAVRCGSRTGKA